MALLLCGLGVLAWRLGVETSIGLFLLLMPLQYLVIALLQFGGVAQFEKISAIKEVVILAAICWQARAARWRPALADGLLGAALMVVSFEQLFHFDLAGLRVDWEWTLLYVLGRLIYLRPATQVLWAKAAVWMCAALSVLAIWEVEVLGPLPRTVLLQTITGEAKLPASFVATGYTGFRAASTMVSPLAFSGLCMVSLVLWWVYMRTPVPAIVISAGLVLTLTRSAFLGNVLAIGVVALRRLEWRRSLLWLLAAGAVLTIAIPMLQLGPFLEASMKAGADTSVAGHQDSVVLGVDVMLRHPLGIGAGTVGPRAFARDGNAVHVESSFLTIAIEYGIVVGSLYAAFFVACLLTLFRVRVSLGYAASAILIGYVTVLAVGPLHLDIPLALWVWVPVGMGVSGAIETRQREHALPASRPQASTFREHAVL